MNNMDALNQPFSWEDFSHKFSKEDIDGMRETLHESEWEGMKDRHLKKMLWNGCDGWENVTDSDVIEMYENIYGETDNVEIVQDKKLGEQVEQIICDKQPNKQLNKRHGKITAKFNDIK
jgi:predicted PolB exonuclease-like 3'-5' exonuclease